MLGVSAAKTMGKQGKMSIEQFRDAVSKSIVTGTRHQINEVNEMAEHIRAAYREYKEAADEMGVFVTGKTLTKQKEILGNRLQTAKDDVERQSIQNEIEMIDDMLAMSKDYPAEDYFTRIYKGNNIREHRAAFKNLVKQWMRQQPYIDTWVLGADELNALLVHFNKNPKANAGKIWKLKHRLKTAPPTSRWARIKASTNPQAIDDRAEEFIDIIMQEAEPADLKVFRESHRPTFGRHRQLNIPNSFLLRDGPNGNGVADFIETNYVMNLKMYNDRMAPAIEMSRRFARPIDGVNWSQGFNEAVENARVAERKSFLKAVRPYEDIPKRNLDDIDFNSLDPIKAYHGTQTRFKKFDEAFIGKGQGFSWEGRGFYFSRQLKTAADFANQAWQKNHGWGPRSGMKGRVKDEVIYEVELPSGANLLNEKGALSQQSPEIQAGIKLLLRKHPDLKNLKPEQSEFGSRLRKALQEKLGKDADINAEFKSFGIKGHSSDKVGGQIVVYNADDIKIIKEPDEFFVQDKEKAFLDHWAPIERDLNELKLRVTNRVFKDPNRWDNRVATVLRDWSHVTFMGMSALPAIQEFGTLIMRHGLSKTFNAAFHDLDSATGQVAKASIAEGKRAGAIMDIHMGTALSGFGETGFDAATTSGLEYHLKTFANKYFLLNGLAPMTAHLKQLDLSVRVPDLLEKIIHVGEDVATEAELEHLARFGISKADAKLMSEQPIDDIDGVFLANTDTWGDEDLVRKFRAAVRQGNENTILAATAADKPAINDGVIYLRKNRGMDKYAKSLGLEEVGDYYRAQSGLLSLPFTFWNYAIAATNKILIAGLDEPSSQKLGGIAAIVGLGYMVAQIKTDPNIWENMTTEQRMTRAIDQSGVVGVLSQYTNLMQGTAIGLTGQNPFPFDPRNGYEPSLTDAAFNIAGAGPSVARNAVQGIVEGDINKFSWALPMRNHIGLKGLFDSAVDGMERKYAGVD